MKIKIVLMVIALFGVIFGMTYLKSGAPLGGLSGLGAGGQVNLCPTRVKSIKNAGELVSIVQEGSEWKVTEPKAKAIDPRFMEHWLAQNCTVKVDANLDKYVLPGGQTETVLGFIDGAETRIVRTEPETFLHQGQAFKSRDLEQALRDLYEMVRQP